MPATRPKLFDLRARGTALLVLAVLLVCAAAGITARRLTTHAPTPLEEARILAREGQFAAAERGYLALARQSPASLQVLVELIDNHAVARLAAASPIESPPSSGDAPPVPVEPLADGPLDDVLAAPGLSLDIAVPARWWRLVAAHRVSDADRAPVVAIADRAAPAAWVNHLLGREAAREDRDDEAADRFAREATFFDDRRGDADAACQRWIEASAWDRLAAALADPRFARQVDADVRLDDALRRRDWVGAARWFLPSQYEGATLGIVLLAAVSGLVWFAICARIGRVRERPRLRVPLYVAAFALGVVSTYVTLAVAMVEHRAFAFAEKGVAVLDAIYFVVGVGLREELSKALLLLPLVPLIHRYGRRREALACGALVGLGFAAEENLGYFHMGLSTALSRFLTANFFHVSTTGLVAVAIDDAVRGRERRAGDLSRTLMLVIVAHGLYDFFLSSSAAEGGGFLSMFVFVLLTRRFVDVLRDLPGRDGALGRSFAVGLALVAGASFVYASVLVGPAHAATALLEGLFGIAIVIYVFLHELRDV